MSIINIKDNKTREIPRRIERSISTNERIENIRRIGEQIGRKKKNTKTKSHSKIKDMITNHIYQNLKEYIIVIILFLIGIIAGVMFVNHMNETQLGQVQEYINQFITSLKGEYKIDSISFLKNSLANNFNLVLMMWFIGSTVIGMPIVLGIVLFRGFCIGYTVSTVIAILGTQKGIIFFIATILLQNIIFIPVLLALAVSGMNLYQSIMRDKRKENVKLEIIRHTIYSILLLIVLIIESFIEVYISSNLLTTCIGFF